MTTPRLRGKTDEAWEERFPRFAANALLTAGAVEGYATEQRRAARFHRKAAVNAVRHSDQVAADLYDEMAKAADDAADALEDVATAARQVARHYGDGEELA
jgi:hypothetical protein